MVQEDLPVEMCSITMMDGDSEKRKSATLKGGDSDSIRVICRFRPPKAVEIEMHGQSTKLENFSIDESRGTVSVDIDFERKSFAYDKVFGINCTQVEIFQSISNTIDSVMLGFNGTILAYGQTSSGKTHTMEGPSLWDTSTQGVIPRAIDKLFQLIGEADVHTAFTVSVSYYEVYCEKIRDLLNPSSDNLKMREVKQEGVVIQDVTEVFCVDRDSILRVIETGKAHRASAPTLMNAESSRSHSILSILVTQKIESTGRHRKGKIFLVDLAGSEKVSKTGAKGARLEEAKNINRSLTTLGMVINALCDGSPHIPYRDSKLSRILQDSLGGNSKTSLIICCASEDRHCSETLSTLRFGERAKKIKNHAKVNEELGLPELKKLLADALREISMLKNQISIGINPSDIQDQPLDRIQGDSEDEEDAASNELYPIRIAELEEQLENERIRSDKLATAHVIRISALAEKSKNKILEGELLALKLTVTELEEKLLEKNLQTKLQKEKEENYCAAVIIENSLNSEQDRNETFKLDERERWSSTDLIVPVGDLENLRQESLQLRTLLVGEIEALESVVVAKNQEAKSAQATASDYALRFGQLRQEHESQVQRLMMKLSQEQLARTELEDRLEQTLQRLWSQQTADGERGKNGFLSKIFSGAQNSDSKLSRAGYISREKDLCRQLETQIGKITQLTAALESNKEAHRIVLETKESVLRSLLKQNALVSQERDALAQRVEELTATVEQLTTLLRNVQNRSLAGVLGEEVSNGAAAIVVKSSFIHGGGHSSPTRPVILGGGKSREIL